MKPDRNNTVCEVCGAMQSNADKDSRMQMHLEGKLHIGYEKIRDKLREIKDKRTDDRRKGYDRHSSRHNHRSRSRSNDRLKKAADEKLKQEAKLYFYYSSNRYGQSSNMPKHSTLGDQGRVKFSDLVVNCNT
jgi:hypothetical protein